MSIAFLSAVPQHEADDRGLDHGKEPHDHGDGCIAFPGSHVDLLNGARTGRTRSDSGVRTYKEEATSRFVRFGALRQTHFRDDALATSALQ